MLIQKTGKMQAVEIMATQTLVSESFKSLKYFDEVCGNKKLIKTLVYIGEQPQKRQAARIVPWSEFDF